MKKLFTINAAVGFALMLTSATSFGQDPHIAILVNTADSRLNYGAANNAISDYAKPLRGIQAGLSWQAVVAKNFSIVTEAYFMRKGGSLKAGNPVSGVESSLKLNTVEMPVLARVHARKFFFDAGPYVNHIVSGKTTTDGEASQSIAFKGASSFKRWEAGLQGGIGYQFAVKQKKFALEARYIHGMTSISRDTDLYNRTINISVILIKSWKGKD